MSKNTPKQPQAREDLREASNPKWFRQVLGQFPTGVCVITAVSAEGHPVGMAVGSFTSVSLDPPLVAFLPDKSSSSWPKVQSAGRFCVNILAADQEGVCRQFASKAKNKFEGIDYRLSATGSPILTNSVAWIDCDIQSAEEAGDHFIVIGAVNDLQIESGELPLLFFQGGYGKFSPLSLAAEDPFDQMTEKLRLVQFARSEMEQVANELDAKCSATVRVGDELVVAAIAASSTKNASGTLVGQRLPFMPPTGAVFVAWDSEKAREDWLAELTSSEEQARCREGVNAVAKRGYSLGLLTEAQREFASTLDRIAEDPSAAHSMNLRQLIQNLAYDPPELTETTKIQIRLINAPVFGPDGTVEFALSLHEFPKPTGESGIQLYIDKLLAAAARVTKKIGGITPAS